MILKRYVASFRLFIVNCTLKLHTLHYYAQYYCYGFNSVMFKIVYFGTVLCLTVQDGATKNDCSLPYSTGWRNENYRCLNRCRSNNFHRIELKTGTHMLQIGEDQIREIGLFPNRQSSLRNDTRENCRVIAFFFGNMFQRQISSHLLFHMVEAG
jgi:hypothetical protein